MKNIEKRGDKFIFHGNCTMCMRCSFNCPKNAISIGFLNSWKVNKPYKLNEIEKSNEIIKGDFIKGGEKGFYSCFNTSFKKIDELYKLYFG